MKILRISLRNIASLAGTHTVDFTREPLRSTGIFAISGPTGSGKSTLLDALCLALYERTPRLTGVRGVVKLADGPGEVSQTDPGTLLRRGTGEGFAEAAFEGVDGQTYTARWQVRRARGKAENALQATEMVLLHGNIAPDQQGVIAQGGRKTEVRAAIAAKIGLSFEQFTRAVLLAQNDFATFLKAPDSERAEILQALTGTGRFETISRQISQRSSLEEKALEAIKARLVGNAPLAPEARLEAEATRAQVEAALKTALDRLAECEKQNAWYKRLAELTEAVARAGTAVRAAQQLREASAPRQIYLEQATEAAHGARPLWTAERQAVAAVEAGEKRRAAALEAWQKALATFEAKGREHDEATKQSAAAHTSQTNAQPELRAARDLDSRLAPFSERLRKAQSERETAETAAKATQAQRDEWHRARERHAAELAILQEKRAGLAALARFAPEAAGWTDRLDHAQAARGLLAGSEKEFADRAKAVTEQAKEVAAERAKESAGRVGVETLRTALDSAEVAARSHDGEQIATKRGETASAREALQRLESNLREIGQAAALASALRKEITQLQAADESDLKTVREIREKQLPLAEATCDGARVAYERARAEVDAATVGLRELLHPEAPCPVCGGLEHPYAAHPPAAEAIALSSLKKSIEQQEKQCKQLGATVAGLEAGVAARGEQAQQKVAALEAAERHLAGRREAVHEHPEARGILALLEEERPAATETRLREIVVEWQAIEAADATRRTAEKHRDDCGAKFRKAAEAFAAFEKNLAELVAKLALAEAVRGSALARRDQHEQELAARLKALAPLLASWPDGEAEFTRDGRALSERFAADAALFLEVEKRLGELATAMGEAGAALVPMEAALVKASTDLIARRSEEAAARADHEALLRQRAAIFGGRLADEVEAEIKTRLETAAQALAARAAEMTEAGAAAAKATHAAQDAEASLGAAVQQRAAAVTDLDAWLTAFAERRQRSCDRAALEAMLVRDEAWFRDERAALAGLENEMKKAEGNLAAHVGVREAHLTTRAADLPEDDGEAAVAAALAAQTNAVVEARTHCDGARAVLLGDDRRISENAELIRQLQAQQAQADPWQKLDELIGSADGAKFRNIAQRHTLDILLGYANAQLDLLATRYRLERIPQSLNLLILDRDMSDERRSVHSLSGGESFLVSLALALGLASLTSQRLRIESLFIDEGFGSLDPETLNVAMGALMNLEAQGRKVGVISHVAEMADAIPVQIKVVKGRGGVSQIVVPGAAVASEAAVDTVTEKSPTMAAPEGAESAVAKQILAILIRAAADGETRVSARALRAEIGCSPAEFAAAREVLEVLGGKVRSEGKSLILVT